VAILVICSSLMQAFSGYSIFAKKLNLPTTPTMQEYKSAYQNYCNKTETEVKLVVPFTVFSIPATFGFPKS
jgi:hypothetical protein